MDDSEKKEKVRREVEEITKAMMCLSTSGRDQGKEEKN
jgi:hypothetical protein